jgi:ectoine hydroxylase-related dioxygenase (phytanoyl-CoA dioxygenase family)
MVKTMQEYGIGLQHVPYNTPLEDILFLIKRDGGVVVKDLVSSEDVDRAHADVRETLDGDLQWNGDFFPSMDTTTGSPITHLGLLTKCHIIEETKRASSMVARSPTYTKTQLMNPVYQDVCAYFLTTRSSFWWGEKQRVSISKPYAQSCVAIEIGPGGKAQPLHRDSYINHTILSEVNKWDDERDRNRESAVGMMVAGCKVTKQNGGTQFIPGSHLWYVKLSQTNSHFPNIRNLTCGSYFPA